MAEAGQLWVIVLAAGEGSRVRSVTKDLDGNSTPKQFYSANGESSMLRTTISRAARLVPRERIVTIVAEQHRLWWERDLADFPPANVIV